MARFLVRRIVYGLFVIWLVTVLVFGMFFIGGGAASVARRWLARRPRRRS